MAYAYLDNFSDNLIQVIESNVHIFSELKICIVSELVSRYIVHGRILIVLVLVSWMFKQICICLKF